MKKFDFSSLNVNRLGVDATYALNVSVIEFVNPLRSALSGVVLATFDHLVATNAALGKGIRQGQKMGLSDDLKFLDVDRDADIKLGFGMVRSYLKRSDPVLKAAATTLQLFYANYKGLSEFPYDVESRLTTEMLAKYKASDELKAAAQVLGVDKVMDSLALKNNAFVEKYESRTTEYAGRVASGSTQKPAANAAFVHFCSSIEITLSFSPDATLEALFNKIDELRKSYHQLEAKTKTAETEPVA